MRQLLTNFGLGLLGGLLAFGGLYLFTSDSFGVTGRQASGSIEWSQTHFKQGLYAGESREFEIGNRGEMVQNGLKTIVVSGSFANATTSLFSVLNPFNRDSAGRDNIASTTNPKATSTLDLFVFETTGLSTSTVTYLCGTTTTAFPNENTGKPSDKLIDDVVVATNTLVRLIAGVTLGPNLASYNDPGTNSARSLSLGPSERIACLVVAGADNDTTGVTGPSNTLKGNYKARFFK